MVSTSFEKIVWFFVLVFLVNFGVKARYMSVFGLKLTQNIKVTMTQLLKAPVF